MIHYRKDKHNIVTLTLDMRGRTVNIINHEIAHVLVPVWEKIRDEEAKGELAGVIITSAKTSFLAGGDLDYLHQLEDAPKVFEHIQVLQKILLDIEKLSVPVVAAINGAAMGSGFELALACHYRIAYDSPKTIIGLPEVNLGMIPMGGSITRLNWLLGIEDAFEIITSGRHYHVREALQRKLIDEIVSDKKDLLLRAHEWILSKPYTVKPWHEPEAVIPRRSNPIYRETLQTISHLNAKLASKTHGNYPAKQAVLNVLKEGALMDFKTAIRVASRYFTSLLLSKECRNLTKAFWFDHNKILNGANRPKGFGRFSAREIGIIGAGLMGSSIAYICAMAGIKVILKDVSVSIAQQGKEYSARRLEKIVAAGKMTQKHQDDILQRIHPTEKLADFEHCDLVIEAVFEGEQLKTRIARETEMFLHRDAFMATNTSSLSISTLSKACAHPRNYIGLHFFAPAHSHPLVEVVCGKDTSDETLARSFDFVKQIGKLPIVVADVPGFYVYKVSKMYILEAITLLCEGQLPTLIENLALQSGMQDSPLSLADRYSLKYMLPIEEQELAQSKTHYPYPQAVEMMRLMTNTHQRQGKSRQAGFYDYQQRPRCLWTGLSEVFGQPQSALPLQDICDRLIFIQCLEAVRSLEQKVIATVAEANLGSIHGWGFVPFRGGTIQFINDYGVEEFVLRCRELQERYGARFEPPMLLQNMAMEQGNFY